MQLICKQKIIGYAKKMKYFILALLITLAGCSDSKPQQGAMHDYTTVIPKTKNNLDAAINANKEKLKEAEENKE